MIPFGKNLKKSEHLTLNWKRMGKLIKQALMGTEKDYFPYFSFLASCIRTSSITASVLYQIEFAVNTDKKH